MAKLNTSASEATLAKAKFVSGVPFKFPDISLSATKAIIKAEHTFLNSYYIIDTDGKRICKAFLGQKDSIHFYDFYNEDVKFDRVILHTPESLQFI